MTPTAEHKKPAMIELTQSLVVAFVFAMVFRGFVVEGFVIPTGSMAPTLLGTHLLKHSDQTGQDFAVGFDNSRGFAPERFSDPLLGRRQPLLLSEAKKVEPRSGDRVLVLKSLFPFFEPKRYDVVVFKNPTDTQGLSANYIKRLIGLPNETIWIVDGEVFAKKGDDEFTIQRKPLHIQRSLWRAVSNSDAIVTDSLALTIPWRGSPWRGSPQSDWINQNRMWSCTTSDPSILTWDSTALFIDDWLPYNMLMPNVKINPISDMRVSATITPESDDLTAGFVLDTLGFRMQWVVTRETGSLIISSKNGQLIEEIQVEIDGTQAFKPMLLECWHADQAMHLFINNTRVASLEYDLGPKERLRRATGADPNEPLSQLVDDDKKEPKLQWQFHGSPFTLTKLRVDHDLYYRDSRLPSRATKNPTKQGNEPLVLTGSPAFGTHPDKLAVLNEDQFFMAGDNSAYSLDSRLWGNPDEFVATQIDDTPFVVHRDLLIGKAWSVYWPAPLSAGPVKLVPDFGRIRFIR